MLKSKLNLNVGPEFEVVDAKGLVLVLLLG